MSKLGPHAIQIGWGYWIEFIEVNGRQERAIDIDPLIVTFGPFWKALETNCVADCCGIHAFSFFNQDIRNASEVMESSELRKAIESLLLSIKASPSDIFVSRRLNNYFDRSTLIQLLEHIHANVDHASPT